MPNWAENDLYIYGSDIRLLEVRRHMETPDTVFDFNKLIPQPEAYHYVSAPTREPTHPYEPFTVWVAKFNGDWEKAIASAIEAFKASGSTFNQSWGGWDPTPEGKVQAWYLTKLCRTAYGHADWYEWCTASWGTKWPAHEASSTRTTRGLRYKFSTAWGGPHPVIAVMAQRWNDLRIIHKVFERGMEFKEVVKYARGVQVNYEKSRYNGQRGG